MSMKSIVTAVMAGCAAVVISAAPGLVAQTHDPQHAATDKAKPASGMAAKDHAMMAEHGEPARHAARGIRQTKAGHQRWPRWANARSKW